MYEKLENGSACASIAATAQNRARDNKVVVAFTSCVTARKPDPIAAMANSSIRNIFQLKFLQLSSTHFQRGGKREKFAMHAGN
jgi:hypothetical protein